MRQNTNFSSLLRYKKYCTIVRHWISRWLHWFWIFQESPFQSKKCLLTANIVSLIMFQSSFFFFFYTSTKQSWPSVFLIVSMVYSVFINIIVTTKYLKNHRRHCRIILFQALLAPTVFFKLFFFFSSFVRREQSPHSCSRETSLGKIYNFWSCLLHLQLFLR